MRSVRAASAAVALGIAPLLAAAQYRTPPPIHYPVRPHPPTPRPPLTPPPRRHRPPHHGAAAPSYVPLIDGHTIERYLATPTPAPRQRRVLETDHAFGQQTFETHATDAGR